MQHRKQWPFNGVYLRNIKYSLEWKSIISWTYKGDANSTFADTSGLMNEFDYKPYTPLDVGVNEFVKWYKKFYGIGKLK